MSRNVHSRAKGGRLEQMAMGEVRNAFLIFGCLCACLAASSCAGSSGLSPGASYFEGLPASVVKEALNNATLRQNLQGESSSSQASLAQAAVRNIIFCREELTVYRAWLDTGVVPKVSPGPVPIHPLEPGNSAISRDYSTLITAIQSGDPTNLQTDLTANGSCGQWVPASPGTTHPTIAQVVEVGR